MALATRQTAERQPVLAELRRHLAATRPHEQERPAGAPARWGRAALAGRLVELSSATGAAALTWAVRLAAEVQRAGRPVAWVMTRADAFYPPDVAANGVALETLALVRVPEAAAVPRAAERLARSGGFGLVVLELHALGPRAALPPALQGRLVQHALRHGTIVLCLTEKPERSPSLGSLVSLRALAQRCRAPQGPAREAAAGAVREAAPGAAAGPAAGTGPGTGPGRWRCALYVAKDKRAGPGGGPEETCHGPPGLR
jgi:recombination protein RecA